MSKKDLFKTFNDEINIEAPKKNYPTNKIVNNHIDDIWSIDLADMIDYKNSNNKEFRCILVIIDNFSKYIWCIPVKNKDSQTITNEFSIIPTTAKRKPLKLESGRGSEWYNSNFLKNFFLKSKKLHHYSGFTDKDP